MFSSDYRNCLKTWKAMTASATDGEPLPHWALLEHTSNPSVLRTRGNLLNDNDNHKDNDDDDAREPKHERSLGRHPKAGVWTQPDEDFWRENLEPIEYRVLRGKSPKAQKDSNKTDDSNNNKTNKKEAEWADQASSLYGDFFPQEGYFACRGCGIPLFSAHSKFQPAPKAPQQQQQPAANSWFGIPLLTDNNIAGGPPTFGCCIAPHLTATLVQKTKGVVVSSQKRAETSCARCGCRLGHCRVEAHPTRFDATLWFGELHVVHGLAVSYVRHALPPAVFDDRGTVLAPPVMLSSDNRPLALYQ